MKIKYKVFRFFLLSDFFSNRQTTTTKAAATATRNTMEIKSQSITGHLDNVNKFCIDW